MFNDSKMSDSRSLSRRTWEQRLGRKGILGENRKFSKNKVMETRELFTKLFSMQYKGQGQVREHIYQMNTNATKLGQLGMEVTDNMLIEFVLKSLPARFDHFKLTYSINEHK